MERVFKDELHIAICVFVPRYFYLIVIDELSILIHLLVKMLR